MGVAFAFFAGFYFWFWKITGFSYKENYAQLHFWITLIGVNWTFFPMHFAGLNGMPRRVPDYPDVYFYWNSISSLGSMYTFLGIVLFFYLIYNAFCLHNYSRIKSMIYDWAIDNFPIIRTYTNRWVSVDWLLKKKYKIAE
jgi:heme/copper-type cytochrome/quinol oxidase subunit 1